MQTDYVSDGKMMKRFKKIGVPIIITVTLAVFFVSLTAVSNSEMINVVLNPQISIQYNGKTETMYDANDNRVYPISYNETTYLPIRALCDLLGINIEWDEASNSINIYDTQATSVNNMQYLKMATEYALNQIPVIEKQQKCIFEQTYTEEVKEYKIDFLYARVNKLVYVTTYREYQIFHYAADYLPNDAALIIPVAGEWEVTDDGWYADKRPLYLVFTDMDSIDIIGEFICEFSPQGNYKQFFKDFDLWVKDGADEGE